MPHPEQSPDQPQAQIPQQETPTPRSWKSYVQQLGERFQVPITEPDNRLILHGRDPQWRLLIGIQHTFAVVSHGRTMEDYELLPDEEICFDISKEGDWIPTEIMYSAEALDEFQESLKRINKPPDR